MLRPRLCVHIVTSQGCGYSHWVKCIVPAKSGNCMECNKIFTSELNDSMPSRSSAKGLGFRVQERGVGV